jgi:hypothetical protein
MQVMFFQPVAQTLFFFRKITTWIDYGTGIFSIVNHVCILLDRVEYESFYSEHSAMSFKSIFPVLGIVLT